MPAYPIELNLRGRLVVVVGLGAVGLRKAAGAVEAEARVIGIDPVPIEIIPGVEVVAESYRVEHLDGAILAFTAATAEVNRRVVADAKRLGIWVNSASDPDDGNFTLPATWRDGPLSLSVSTGGASPALASALRDRAAASLGASAVGLVRLLAELRPEVFATIPDPETRRRAFAEAAHPRWLDFLAAEGPDATRLALRKALGLALKCVGIPDQIMDEAEARGDIEGIDLPMP